MLRCYGRRFIKSDQSNRIGNAPQKCTGGWINSEILWGWKCSRHGILIWNQAIFMASDMITIINGGQGSIDHGQVGIVLVESSIWYSRNDIKRIYKCFTAKLSVQSCLWKIYKPLKSNGDLRWQSGMSHQSTSTLWWFFSLSSNPPHQIPRAMKTKLALEIFMSLCNKLKFQRHNALFKMAAINW